MMVLLFYIGTIPADSMALCVTPRNIRTETDWDVYVGSASGDLEDRVNSRVNSAKYVPGT